MSTPSTRASGRSRRGYGLIGCVGIAADSCGTTRIAPAPLPSMPSTWVANAWIHAFAS